MKNFSKKKTAQVRQVVYGHGDVVTCLARSEITVFADCYIASGSADCTVVLWHFSKQLGAIAGEYNTPGEMPSPRVSRQRSYRDGRNLVKEP